MSNERLPTYSFEPISRDSFGLLFTGAAQGIRARLLQTVEAWTVRAVRRLWKRNDVAGGVRHCSRDQGNLVHLCRTERERQLASSLCTLELDGRAGPQARDEDEPPFPSESGLRLSIDRRR